MGPGDEPCMPFVKDLSFNYLKSANFVVQNSIQHLPSLVIQDIPLVVSLIFYLVESPH